MKKSLKYSITNLSEEELLDIVTSQGQPGYRARQIITKIYRNLAFSWDQLTEIPQSLRDALAAKYTLHGLEPVTTQIAGDGTIKTLFKLADGRTIEAALMLYQRTSGDGNRGTVCVSSQVGCTIGCPFCATGNNGFERNLTHGEIVDQVLYFARFIKDRQSKQKAQDNAITNIVYMGMGEPLSNYEELMKSIRVLNDPAGMNIGARSITVSTAGVVPGILKLAGENLQVGLAISLHAGTNSLRDKLVPLNKKYPVEEVVAAGAEYFAITGRRVSYEYALFKDINDSLPEARHVGRLLEGQNCHVNLIPANRTGQTNYQAPPDGEVLAFMTELRKYHLAVTIRQSKGRDIDAACGQLRSRMSSISRKISR